MSRSRRRTPIVGMTSAESDKAYKVREHRRARRIARDVLSTSLDGDHKRLHPRAYGDPCRSDKDGKQYFVALSAFRK